MQFHFVKRQLIPITALLLTLGNSLASAHDAGVKHPDAHALLARVISTVGYSTDLHAIVGIRSNAVNTNFDIVEFDHADGPYLVAGVTNTAIIDDLRGDRRLIERISPSTATGRPSTTSRTLLTAHTLQIDTVPAGQSATSQLIEAPPSWETDEPLRTLLLAEHAEDLSQLSDETRHGVRQHVLAFHHGSNPVRLYIDAASNLPSAIETTISLQRAMSQDLGWNGWGDLVDRVELMNYALIDGVRYPQQFDLLRNGVELRSTVLKDIHVQNSLNENLLHMQAFTGTPDHRHLSELSLGEAVSQAPDPKKPIAEIAPGIVQIPGSWYSTIVRQDDGVVIIDAPISADYSRRVIDEAKRRFPAAPIKALITSTAFYWHIAGIREYAAQGIPIFCRDRNVAVLRAMLAAPHKLVPDDLARSPRAPIIHGVSGPTVIGTGRNAMTVIPIREGEQPMVMTWIPDAHLLHSAEMVQPLGPNGALLFPEALLELKNSLQAAQISDDGLRLIGMHMSPTPWAEVEKVLDHSKRIGMANTRLPD